MCSCQVAAGLLYMCGKLAWHEHIPAWLFDEQTCTSEMLKTAWLISVTTPALHRRPPPHRGSSWSRHPPLVPLAPWPWALHPCPKRHPPPFRHLSLPARRWRRPASRWQLQSTPLLAAAAGAEGAVQAAEAEVEEAWAACCLTAQQPHGGWLAVHCRLHASNVPCRLGLLARCNGHWLKGGQA